MKGCKCAHGLQGYPFTWPQPDFANRRLRDMPTQLPVGAIGNYTRGVFDERDPYAMPSYARGDAGVDGFGAASLLDPIKSAASDVAQAAYNAAAATAQAAAQAAYDAVTGTVPTTGPIYTATGILPLVNQTTISTSAPVARTGGIVSGGTLSRFTLTKKADTTATTATTATTDTTDDTTKSSGVATALKVAGLAGAALLLVKLLKG